MTLPGWRLRWMESDSSSPPSADQMFGEPVSSSIVAPKIRAVHLPDALHMSGEHNAPRQHDPPDSKGSNQSPSLVHDRHSAPRSDRVAAVRDGASAMAACGATKRLQPSGKREPCRLFHEAAVASPAAEPGGMTAAPMQPGRLVCLVSPFELGRSRRSRSVESSALARSRSVGRERACFWG
jgi:hypothetical protein